MALARGTSSASALLGPTTSVSGEASAAGSNLGSDGSRRKPPRSQQSQQLSEGSGGSWGMTPKNKKGPWNKRGKRKFFQKKIKKIRGNVATSIVLPGSIRILGNVYVMILIESLVALFCYLFWGLLFYELAFYSSNARRVVAVYYISQVLIFVDLLMRLGVEVYRHSQDVECIFFFVPFSFKFYFIHMLCLFPYHLLFLRVVNNNSIYFLNWYECMYLPRGLLVLRMASLYHHLEVDRVLSELWVFILQFFSVFLGLVHLVACMYGWATGTLYMGFLLGNDNAELKGTWLEKSQKVRPDLGSSPKDNYVVALLFSATTISTVGYGHPHSYHEREMVINIVIMLFGAIGLAGIFGSQLTSFLLERDGARYDLFHRVQSITAEVKELRSTSLFAHKVKEYYDCLWNFREGVYEVPAIQSMIPPSLSRDILYDICTEMFVKSVLFRGLEEPFLRAVSRTVEVVLYNPDMIICQAGDASLTMYYIIQGECLVKSRHNPNITSAILRAGCIFGETSLFLSIPHIVNVETKTVCQLLRLRKESLMELFNDHFHMLSLIRARFRERLKGLRRYYSLAGAHPITFVSFTGDMKDWDDTPFAQHLTVLRWSTGFNSPVTEDIIDDSEATVIVDMPCPDPTLEKNKSIAYTSCVIPPTLALTSKLIHVWHVFVLSWAAVYCFIGPYILAFNRTHELPFYLNAICEHMEILLTGMYVADVFVEILTACPVSGWYYKFRDGIRIKSREMVFYFDILATIPVLLVTLFPEGGYKFFAKSTVVAFKCMKIHKILRYINYLSNMNPGRIFWLRLVQTLMMLVFCIHILACTLFCLACPPWKNRLNKGKKDIVAICRTASWLNSLYIDKWLTLGELDPSLQVNELANRMPYLLSLHFAAATFTSVGFGDFVPRNKLEIYAILIAIIISFNMTGYHTALLTSGLSCVTRPKVMFQQKLVSIRYFLNYNGLSMTLQDRIVEHYSLQHQYNRGVHLPPGRHSLMYDAPPYLEQDYLFASLATFLEGIPLLAAVDQNVVIRMAQTLVRTILPPDIYFLRRGEVRRQMHLVYKGSVAIMVEESEEVKQILQASGSFGIRDLLYGEPSHNYVKTLSYCIIYSIDLEGYNLALGRDAHLMDEVAKNKKLNEDTINEVNILYAAAGKLKHMPERKPTKIPSWITFPSHDYPMDTKLEREEFRGPYRGDFGKILKACLMKRTVHPAGAFALFWSVLMGLMAMTLFLVEFCQLYLYYYHTALNTTIILLKLFYCADMYLRMHWAYYGEANFLVCHPVLTFRRYAYEGGLAYGFSLELAPYAYVLFLLRAVGVDIVGDGRVWMAKFNIFIATIRVHRVPIIVSFARQIFGWRTLVLMTLYIIMTLFIVTWASNYALNLACPWDGSAWEKGDEYRLRACLGGTWITTKLSRKWIDTFATRWLASTYYICQVILVIGYGDMVTVNEDELLMLLFLMIFGFAVTRIIISDITAASVDSDEIRANFSEQMHCLEWVMNRQNVHQKLIRNAMDHMEHTWLLSKGLEPQELLGDLHPALRSDLFKEYIGDAVSRIPLFSGVSENILRTVYLYMKKQHFIRGERIMRRGNLEFEMYIIVDGTVWIADKNLEYKCVLGPGECMGETQMIYGLQRRYSAIAASSVEVFALSSKGLSEILERYPRFMEDLESNLHHKQKDLFERKVEVLNDSAKNLVPKTRDRFKKQVLQYSADIRELVYAREVAGFGEDDDENVIESKNFIVAYISRNLVSYGPLNISLPYFYFASPESLEKNFVFLLHPNCGFQKLLHLLVLTICIVSSTLSIYHLFLVPKGSDAHDTGNYLEMMILTCDLIYILHILIQFITPFPTVHGQYCKEPKRVAFRYVSQLSRFWIDVISCFPIEFISEHTEETFWTYLNILHVLRLIHFYRSIFETRDLITTTTFRFNLTVSVTSFGVMSHLLACIFYGVSICEKLTKGVHVCEPDTWPSQFLKNHEASSKKEQGSEHYNWYIRSMYFIISTVSTTGTGDIVPVNLRELVVTVVCIFCGAFVLSVILSLFTSGLTSRSKYYREYTYQVKLLKTYFLNIGLSNVKTRQLQTWFHLFWNCCRGVTYRRATRVLPLSLQIDVDLALYYETLKMVPLFEGFDKRILRQIAHRLSHMIYYAGMNVVSEGDGGDSLYIVSRGRISGYTVTRRGHARLIRWYDPGSCFGRLPALFYEKTYTKTYRAEVTSEVLILRQRDIFHLAINFPSLATILQHYISSHYNPDISTNTIFTAPEEQGQRAKAESNKRVLYKRKQNKSTSPFDYYNKKKTRMKTLQEKGRLKTTRSRAKREIPMTDSQELAEEKEMKDKIKELLDAHAHLRAKNARESQDSGRTKEEQEEQEEEDKQAKAPKSKPKKQAAKPKSSPKEDAGNDESPDDAKPKKKAFKSQKRSKENAGNDESPDDARPKKKAFKSQKRSKEDAGNNESPDDAKPKKKAFKSKKLSNEEREDSEDNTKPKKKLAPKPKKSLLKDDDGKTREESEDPKPKQQQLTPKSKTAPKDEDNENPRKDSEDPKPKVPKSKRTPKREGETSRKESGGANKPNEQTRGSSSAPKAEEDGEIRKDSNNDATKSKKGKKSKASKASKAPKVSKRDEWKD